MARWRRAPAHRAQAQTATVDPCERGGRLLYADHIERRISCQGLSNFEFTLSTAERNLQRSEEMLRAEKSQDYQDLYLGLIRIHILFHACEVRFSVLG